ncbi:ABC transporter permease [Intestinibaculum porci]|jgi:putative ABC transport system permease protein|uniref:ABC transporter permease n=1 Tax=Intestinibaculum porci TaxID=2487118 RepID=A0A3G9JP31_9FIRM|nr:ABC transporter permease [Intestinibaculum porci]BBH26008.1 ABC transporter permease [Intestinibaculum porci]HAN58268.1 ABC transporter permease [Erysipelotrichaceae bacterium]
MAFLLAIQGALNQGILWSIMALGVYITFRLLDVADLTVDGSFATGGAVAAVILVKGGNPLIAILAAALAGCLAGWVTGFLLTKCHIPAILAGILSQIGLYSINLRIMGKSNIPLLATKSLFDWYYMFNITQTQASIIVGVIITLLVVIALYWFFGTELGAAIRATGNNEQMVRAVGVNTDFTKIVGTTLSNGLIALSGGLVAQQQGFADVKMGIGAIVIGLASIVIGEVLFAGKGNFFVHLLSIVVGSIIYRIVIALVLQMGLSTDDLKLLTAIVVGIALAVPHVLASRRQKALYKKLTSEVDRRA